MEFLEHSEGDQDPSLRSMTLASSIVGQPRMELQPIKRTMRQITATTIGLVPSLFIRVVVIVF